MSQAQTAGRTLVDGGRGDRSRMNMSRRSRSTTRRCGTGRSSRGSRSRSRTSCGSPSSSTGSGVHYIEAGWPGANPKDDELFRRVPTELKLETSTLVAFGSTRRVKGKVDSDDTLRHLVEANVGTVCIVGKSWDYHVTEALGTTLDEGVAMVGDSVEFLRRSGMDVLFDAEHFFDGFKRNPEFSLRVLEAAATNGASHLVLCDTNGGALPARGGAGRRRGRALLRRRREGRGAPPRRRGHRRGQRARGRARRRDAGAGNDQRLRRAHRELQPHDDHPEPHAEDGLRDDSARPPRAADAGRAPRRRARQHAAQPAGRVRRSFRVRAQGRVAHERDREAPRRVRARLARGRRQRHPVRRVRARGQVDARAEGQGARALARRAAARRRRRDVEAARARGLPLRGRRRLARAADAARRRVGNRSGSGSSRSG